MVVSTLNADQVTVPNYIVYMNENSIFAKYVFLLFFYALNVAVVEYPCIILIVYETNMFTKSMLNTWSVNLFIYVI